MDALLNFTEFVIQALLSLIIWVVIIYAIASWLISFEVINLRNRIVYSIWRALEAVVRPILRPIQRIIPPLGGSIDISPVLLFIVIGGLQRFLIPAFFAWLHGLLGAGVAV